MFVVIFLIFVFGIDYHDYSKLYKEWHPNITKEDLDNKIIMSAINFWFKDEDAGVGKVWNYFKNIG